MWLRRLTYSSRLGFTSKVTGCFTLGSEKHTVLRVLPSDAGVITYYFSGFGDTGMECHRVSGLMDLGQSTCDARLRAGRPHS